MKHKQPDRLHNNQTRLRNAVLHSKTYPSTNCVSNYHPMQRNPKQCLKYNSADFRMTQFSDIYWQFRVNIKASKRFGIQIQHLKGSSNDISE